MAGKEFIAKWLTFQIDDSGGTPRDLSKDLLPGSLGAVGLDFERVDMTGSAEVVQRALGNRANADIEAKFHMNDTATTGATTVLNGIDDGITAGTLTVQYGGGGVPATGDPEWEGEYILLRNMIEQDGGRMIHNCLWTPDPGTAADPAWGTVA